MKGCGLLGHGVRLSWSYRSRMIPNFLAEEQGEDLQVFRSCFEETIMMTSTLDVLNLRS